MILMIMILMIGFGHAVQDNLSNLRHIVPSTGLWEPTATEFTDYIINGPRNYSVILLYTSETHEIPCQYCPVVRSEFERYASFYQNAYSVGRRDLFFVVAEWKRSKEILSKHNKKFKRNAYDHLIITNHQTRGSI